jgi:hypothetical protein
MFETKYFSITKLIKQYKENWKELEKSPSNINYDKIQLVSLGKDGYQYLKNDNYQGIGKEKNRYFYLQCLLHGAIRRINDGKIGEKVTVHDKSYEERLQDFLIKELQLLWGMYCFIDPESGHTDDAKSYYLLGPFGKTQLKPSFTFPHFININNFRDNVEFHKLPEKWLSFYIDLNAATRKKIEFRNDFVKFFDTDAWRRNNLEHHNNFLYVSSGEMDHAILQWLFCYLAKTNTHYSESFNLEIGELEKGELGELLESFFDNNEHTEVKEKITFRHEEKLFLGESGKNGDPSHNIYDWLQSFGLLKENELLKANGVPTERLVTAIEFFYFHIHHWKTKQTDEKFKTKNYFSRKSDDHFYGKHFFKRDRSFNKKIERFLQVCKENLPVEKNYFDLREKVTVDNVQSKVSDLLDSYFDVLAEFANKNKHSHFTEYCRFNIVSHFFQRNVLSLYNPVLREQTCRGFIITPIFSNPEQPAAENLKYLGYFLGLIKDSDSKGRCYFNWRTHSDEDESESKTINFFYNEYLFYLQDFVFRIGFNEVKQIYYRGIEENHKKETERQATRAAIADIVNRNQAHHIGSHVSNRATLDKVLERLGENNEYLADINDYLSILDLLNRFNQYRDERGEYLTYLAQFSSPSSAYLFKDVLQPFIENSLLMDNIAANENINYESDGNGNLTNNKLQLRIILDKNGGKSSLKGDYKREDGSLLYSSENLPYLRIKTDKGFEYEKVELNHEDIEVSLPGTLGKHALYSILENFIRNSAKHGCNKKDAGLEVIIELSNLDASDFITVKLTDNCSLIEDSKIKEFNESLQTRILDRKDLGLIDMKVNACLLEGKELTDENCKKALKVGKTSEGFLFYEFKVAKPKKAVFIGCNPKIKNKENKGYFYFKNLGAYIEAKRSKSFKFAVINKKLLEEYIGAETVKFPDFAKFKDDKELLEYRKIEAGMLLFSQLPARVLYYEDIENKMSEVNDSEILTVLYEQWNAHLSESKKINFKVHLTFQQSQVDKTTESFNNCAKLTSHPFLEFYTKEKLSSGVSFEDDKQHIFFDRHGAIIGTNGFTKSFVKDNGNGNKGKNHCWILIDKNNTDFDYITRYDLTNADLLAYELAEAGLLRILVIDERASEQSIRTVEDDDRRKLKPYRFGFDKFDLSEKNKLTLFDSAWAANVFIATHLNEAPLKNDIKIDDGDKHLLKVRIENNGINYDVNFTSLYGTYNPKTREEKAFWSLKDSQPKFQSIELNPHILVIHRTKLKDLMEKDPNIVEKITQNIPNIIVTTGSSTTHGMKGDFKILPFSTLNETLLGKRIQKLRLSKLLLELTKNRI